jgi:hypothetical protein
MQEDKVRAIFLLAGFEVTAITKVENKYWPVEYVEQIAASPWWEVETQLGKITIGWRKRVIVIDWTSTGFEYIVTNDQVTKDEVHVHAFSYALAVEYLSALLRWWMIKNSQKDG